MKTKFLWILVVLMTGLAVDATGKSKALTGSWVAVRTSTNAPDNKAVGLVMQLNPNGSKLTGSFLEISGGKAGIDGARTDARGLPCSWCPPIGKPTEIREGKVNGATFEYTTYRKINNVFIGTHYRGELVDPMTIKLVRLNPVGRPIDRNPDGTAEPLLFHRDK